MLKREKKTPCAIVTAKVPILDKQSNKPLALEVDQQNADAQAKNQKQNKGTNNKQKQRHSNQNRT
jgi:hypothetical protein